MPMGERSAMRPGGRELILASTLAAVVLTGTTSARAEGNWVRGNAFDAIVLGKDVDGSPLQPCLASEPGYPGQHPGKTRPDWGHCSFGYGGREVFTTSYATLRPTWTRSREAGMTFGHEANGTPQAFCRGPYAGGLQVGKKIAGDDGCYVPYGGQEIRLTDYEVLTQGSSFALRALPQQALQDVAIVAGYEADGRSLYACIAGFADGAHLGKTRRDWTDCMVSYGGSERAVRTFQVLVPLVQVGLGSAPILRAGSEQSQALGVCAGDVSNSWQVGKYLFSNGSCNVSFGGQEIRLPESSFAILRGVSGVAKSAQDRGTTMPPNKSDQEMAAPNTPGVSKNPSKNDPPPAKSDQGKADPKRPGVNKNPSKNDN